MPDVLASLSVVLGAEISGFKAAMAQARKELRGLVQFSEGLQDIGKSLTTYVTAPLAGLATGAVVASAKVESLRRGLEAITQQELGRQGITGLAGVAEAARLTGARINELQEIARQPGLDLVGAEQADVRLRAVGISAAQSAKSISAFANAVATTGGGADEFSRVTVQLAQLSAKGKVLAQDLRPIIEAAPAVATALQNLYGTVDSETISASLAKQGQSSKDFIRVLTDELAKLPQVTAGLRAVYENDLDALLVASAKVGDGIAKAFDLQGFGERLGEQITQLGNAFAGLSPETQRTIVVLGGLAAATGPVITGLGVIGVSLPYVKTGFLAVTTAVELVGAGLTALTGPVGLAALGIAALAAGTYYLATANSRAYDSYLKQIAVTQKLTSEVSPLLDRYDELRSKSALTTTEQAELKAIIEKVTAALPAAGQGLDRYGNYLGLATDKARELIAANQELDKAIALKSLPGQQAKLATLERQYSNLTRIRDEFNRTGLIKYGADDKTGYAPGTQELIEFRAQLEQTNTALTAQKKVVAELGGVVNGTANDYKLFDEAYRKFQTGLSAGAQGVAVQTGLLAKLEQQLKDTRDAKSSLTTEAQIKASNILIASLEAQIKRLNELGVGSNKANEALAELKKRLLDNQNAALALGEGYDFLKNKANILKEGVISLTANGWEPGGKVVQGYVEQIRILGLAIDNLKPKLVLIKDDLPKTLFNLNGDNSPDAETQADKYDRDKAKYDKVVNAQKNAQAIFTQQLADFNTQSEELTEQLKNNIINSLADIGSAFGSVFFDGASVGSALAAAFAPIVDTLAEFAAQKAKLYIALGIADLAVPGLQAQGAAELAGGTALLLASGIASAGAASLRSSVRSGGGGGLNTAAASAPRNFTPTVAPGAAAAGPSKVTHIVTFEIAGSKLQGVLKLADERLGRVVGR